MAPDPNDDHVTVDEDEVIGTDDPAVDEQETTATRQRAKAPKPS